MTQNDFYSIISSSMDGFLLVDLKGNILETNESFCHMVGYPRDELLNIHISSIDDIDNKEDVARRLEIILQQGSLGFTTKHRHKDGSVIEVEVSANYSAAHGGSIISFIRDITSQKNTLDIMATRLRLMEYALNHSLKELLQKTLDEAEILTDSCIGSFHFLDPDLQTLTLQTWSTSTSAMFCKTEGADSHYPVAQTSAWADCVYERRPVIHNDFAAMPHRQEVPEGHVTVIREMVIPVFRYDNIVAIVGVGNKATDYSQKDVEMITRLSDLAWDIAEHKIAEEALRQEKTFLRSLIDSADDLIYFKDRNGVYLACNKASENFVGLSESEQIGKSDFDLFDHETAALVAQQDKAVLENGEIFRAEVVVPHPEAGRVVMDTVKAPIYGPDNRPIGLVGISRDITERKRTEKALAESEFFFKESQRAAHIGSYRADFIQNYWVSSEVLDSIFGIDQNADRSVQGWLDVVHPDDREMMKRYLQEEIISRKNHFAKEYRIVRKNDGETRWVNGLGEAVFDTTGNIVSLAGTIQDISERTRLEEEKLTLEQQFQQTQKLESLGVLAGGIAHDFNNLLAVIIGHCSLAAMRPDAAANHIPPIEKAADRAAGLCRQMLAYAGKAAFTLTPLNLTDLVDDMVQMLKATTSQNVAFMTDFCAGLPALKGDASQLRQIIMNLIINASEAIGDTPGVINIKLTKTAITAGEPVKDHLGRAIPSGWYACLEVSDTGCGMDDETRRRIFEPFYTTKFTGRGLGMSAVLGIISAHSGSLQFTSRQNQGTTFKIYLPVVVSNPNEEASIEQKASAPWQGYGTILLVEDEIQVMLVAKDMLEELGFTVIEASNGKQALELYHNNAADITLVVTDIGMPVMDGYALFRELKELNSELPVIISSGFGDTVITTRIPVKEIAGLISKPYSFDQLRDTLKEVVERTAKP